MEIKLLLLLPIDALKLLGGAIPLPPAYWLRPQGCSFLKLRDRGASGLDFLLSLSLIYIVTVTFSTVLFPFALSKC